MKTKTYKANVKAVNDAPDGTFEALVSVFGNVDHAGDRVVKGAFAKSLERWGQSGDPIPVVFSHRWDDLDAHIGKVLTAEETDEGLLVTAQLDIEDDPAAAKVHRLLKDRRIREFSFAYDVLDEKAANGANELLELDIIEVGPTLKGMNPETVLVAAKNRQRKVYAPVAGSVEQRQATIRDAVNAWARAQAENAYAYVEATFDDAVVFEVEDVDGHRTLQAAYTVGDDGEVELGEPTEVELEATIRAAARDGKAGRALSAKNETNLREARDRIDVVLAALDDGDTKTSAPQGAAGGEAKPDAKPEDPSGGKGEELTARSQTPSPADLRLQVGLDMARL